MNSELPQTSHSLQTVKPARATPCRDVKDKLDVLPQREGLDNLISHVFTVDLSDVHDGTQEDEESNDPEKSHYYVVFRPPVSRVDLTVRATDCKDV